MAFSHPGNFCSMDLAGLPRAIMSAGSDRVTCISSAMVCQSQGGVSDLAETLSRHASDLSPLATLIPWILQRESSKGMLGVAWPHNSA